eukprot:1361341-Amorphochlora_amoeboformis.AAC.1
MYTHLNWGYIPTHNIGAYPANFGGVIESPLISPKSRGNLQKYPENLQESPRKAKPRPGLSDATNMRPVV